MFKKINIFFILTFSLSACLSSKPFQPPPHPAELWTKQEYVYADVLKAMKKCGWIEPQYNLNASGKINMDLYAQVDKCMQDKGFIYVGKTPLTCQQPAYQRLPACQFKHVN